MAKSAERQQFDADVARVKSGLRLSDDGKIFFKERGLGPRIAGDRLRERGVDIEGLLGSDVPTDLDYAKGGKTSASKRGDGIAKRGKTRGKMV